MSKYFSNGIFFIITLVVCNSKDTPRIGSCWQKNANVTYPGLTATKNNMYHKCRSLCLEFNQLFGKCSVFAFGSQCKLSLDENKPNTEKLTEKDGTSTFFLKDECKRDACWSRSYDFVTDLHEVEAKNEKHCRFICLETYYCYYMAYSKNTCYIQRLHTLEPGWFKHGDLYKLKELCKQEACWMRTDRHDKTFEELKLHEKIKSDYCCRMKCLESRACHFYKWNLKSNQCYILEGPVPRAPDKWNTDYVYYDLSWHCQLR